MDTPTKQDKLAKNAWSQFCQDPNNQKISTTDVQISQDATKNFLSEIEKHKQKVCAAYRRARSYHII